MDDHADFEKKMTDQQITEVILAMDRQTLPLNRRMDGDDLAIRELVDKLKVKQGTTHMYMVTGAVLREAAHRGIKVPRGN